MLSGYSRDLRSLYVLVVLFGLLVVLGGYLVEPLLTLYLVFYRSLELFYVIPLLGFVFYFSSSVARVVLVLWPRLSRGYIVVSAILLPLSVLMYMFANETLIFIVRTVHGFSLSTLVTSMWITLLSMSNDPRVIGRYVGVFNASMGLSTSIAFILSYKLVFDYGFNWLFLIALALSASSLAFAVFLGGVRANGIRCRKSSDASSRVEYWGSRAGVSLAVLAVVFSVFAKNLGYGITKPFIPAYVVLLFNHVLLAWSMFVYAGLAYVLGSLTGVIAVKAGATRLSMPFSLLVVCLGALTYVYADSPEKFMIASVIASYGSALFKVSYINYLARTNGLGLVIIALSLASLGLGIGSLLSICIADIRFSFTVYSMLTAISLLVLVVAKILGYGK